MNIFYKPLLLVCVMGLTQMNFAGTGRAWEQAIIQNVFPNEDLVLLTVKANHRNQVMLSWNTGLSNDYHYTIERSSDGTEWKTIAIFFPSEEQELKSYNYTDGPLKGRFFYRIASVSRSGKSFYSASKMVSTINKIAVSVYQSRPHTIVAEIAPAFADPGFALVLMNGQTITKRTFSKLNGQLAFTANPEAVNPCSSDSRFRKS